MFLEQGVTDVLFELGLLGWPLQAEADMAQDAVTAAERCCGEQVICGLCGVYLLASPLLSC